MISYCFRVFTNRNGFYARVENSPPVLARLHRRSPDAPAHLSPTAAFGKETKAIPKNNE